jgi:carbonic anhydrase
VSTDQIAELLSANRDYAAAMGEVPPGRPSRHLAVVTCMDGRLDVFAALGLRLGEAHIIRNAGGRVTDDALRSLALSTNVLGTDTAVVMHHTKCGLAGVTDKELQDATGAAMEFFPIEDHVAALKADVNRLVTQPYLALVQVVVGFLYDVDTGEVEQIVDWMRDPATA